MLKVIQQFLSRFPIRNPFRKPKSSDGLDGQSVAVGSYAYAKGGEGGKGSNGSRGGNGGDAVALGRNSIAIGGRGGDAN